MTTAGVALAQNPAAPGGNQADRAEVGQEVLNTLENLPPPATTLRNMQNSLKMAFMMADQNNDGLISQREATDAGNLLVGGLFFAADLNGDGQLSRDEVQQIRDRMFQQNPLLRVIAQRAQAAGAEGQPNTNPLATLGNALDADNDQQVSAAEVRRTVSSAVQGMFAVADTNRDGQLSPDELNAAVYGAARAAVQGSFQAADRDNNGAISQEEFTQALTEPAQAVFGMLDLDSDGQLSQQELQRATQFIATQLQNMQLPQADNSLDQLIREGRTPGQGGTPVPNINVPAQPGAAPRQPGAVPPSTPARTVPPGTAPGTVPPGL